LERNEIKVNVELLFKIAAIGILVAVLHQVLCRAGINTVEELTNRTPEDMMKARNLGRKSLEEVLAKLDELGLSLSKGEE